MPIAQQLLQAAAQNRIVLIPTKDELLIRAPATAPDDLVDMLHQFSTEIAATLRGQQQTQRHW